jgi:hypothetical protein
MIVIAKNKYFDLLIWLSTDYLFVYSVLVSLV